VMMSSAVAFQMNGLGSVLSATLADDL